MVSTDFGALWVALITSRSKPLKNYQAKLFYHISQTLEFLLLPSTVYFKNFCLLLLGKAMGGFNSLTKKKKHTVVLKSAFSHVCWLQGILPQRGLPGSSCTRFFGSIKSFWQMQSFTPINGYSSANKLDMDAFKSWESFLKGADEVIGTGNRST